MTTNQPEEGFSFQLERCIVETAAELADAQGRKYVTLANIAFGNKKDAGRRWRQIRGSKIQKPQRLTIDDAARLAAALGKELPELVFLANERLKAGWEYIPR